MAIIPPTSIVRSVPSLYQGTHLRTDCAHCKESTGTRPEIPKVVPGTDAAFSGTTVNDFLCASLFPRPLSVCSGHVWYIEHRRRAQNTDLCAKSHKRCIEGVYLARCLTSSVDSEIQTQI